MAAEKASGPGATIRQSTRLSQLVNRYRVVPGITGAG